MNVTTKAFTLIELLIVVAIIAILAAIAVPNFLEAQVRSQVARVKSDMRTVATALEAYVVDNNEYPPGIAPFWISQAGSNPWGSGCGSAWLLNLRNGGVTYVGAGWYLTTPVAYITSIPNDPWMGTYYGSVFGGNAYIWEFGSFFYRRAWDCDRYGQAVPMVESIDGYNYKATWFLQSCGPDNICWHHHPVGHYDPTNGTVSTGDIVWWEKEGLRGG